MGRLWSDLGLIKRGLMFAIKNITIIAFTIENIFNSVYIGQLADGVRALDFKPDDPRLFLVNERVPPPKNITESCFYICNPADYQMSGWNWRRSHLHGNNRIFIFLPGEYIFPCLSIRKCSFDLQQNHTIYFGSNLKSSVPNRQNWYNNGTPSIWLGNHGRLSALLVHWSVSKSLVLFLQ